MNIEEVRKAAEIVELHKSRKAIQPADVLFPAMRILADMAIEELARRDAEAAERALPITRNWLRTLGFERFPDEIYPHSQGNDNERITINGSYLRLWPFNGECWLIGGCDGFELKTQGQLLDLLAALKGGEA